jgi:hypothetical protein
VGGGIKTQCLILLEGAAPDGGNTATPLPAQAWPGRIMIAKPFRSYLPAVNEVSAAGPGRISRLEARRSARPHHRYKLTPEGGNIAGHVEQLQAKERHDVADDDYD